VGSIRSVRVGLAGAISTPVGMQPLNQMAGATAAVADGSYGAVVANLIEQKRVCRIQSNLV
jgi:hypothetical protein